MWINFFIWVENRIVIFSFFRWLSNVLIIVFDLFVIGNICLWFFFFKCMFCDLKKFMILKLFYCVNVLYKKFLFLGICVIKLLIGWLFVMLYWLLFVISSFFFVFLFFLIKSMCVFCLVVLIVVIILFVLVLIMIILYSFFIFLF